MRGHGNIVRMRLSLSPAKSTGSSDTSGAQSNTFYDGWVLVVTPSS